MATIEACQLQYDAQEPPEGRYFAESEQLLHAHTTFDYAMDAYFAGIDTFRRLVPQNEQESTEIRSRLEGQIDRLEERQGEYGGRIFDPLIRLKALAKSKNLMLGLVPGSRDYTVTGYTPAGWSVVATGNTPMLAVLNAERALDNR